MNLIFCAYAHKEDFQSGANIQVSDRQNVYLKNAYVALKSTKINNPDDAVALITNIQLDAYWNQLFSNENIQIIYKKYDEFIFDKDYGWSLAFYKLCALKYVLNLNFSNYLLLDTDVYVQRNLNDVWVECEHNILISEINRGLYNGDYLTFCREAQSFLSTSEYLSRWGGIYRW